MKLLGTTKSKFSENSEKVPHLEITEVVLMHFTIVNNDYQQDSRDKIQLLEIEYKINITLVII